MRLSTEHVAQMLRIVHLQRIELLQMSEAFTEKLRDPTSVVAR